MMLRFAAQRSHSGVRSGSESAGSIRVGVYFAGAVGRESPLFRLEPSGDSMSKIRPLQDRVIIKRVKEEEKSKGGIIIPDTAKEKPIEGEVMAVGNGKVQEDGTVRPLEVKVGDRVLFGKYTGNEVKIDGEDRLIIREDDILGVILN
jgi:chaperonin GroES